MKIYIPLLAAFMLAIPASSQTNWFAPDAAARQNVNDALETARQANHRVILIYDGGWCNLCTEAHEAAMSDPKVPELLHSGYELAHVTVDDFDALQQFAQKNLHAKLDKTNGLLISILDKDGAVLSTWTAARLQDAGHISAAKLKAQLSEWLVGAPAEQVYRTALASLPAGKAGFVEFRADWCGWCKKMEKFFQDSDAAPVLAKYYSVISIDTEKNSGADELAKRLGSPKGSDGGGIPWFAVVDSQGKVVATSEGPKGNIGYPDTDIEVTHYMSVMKSTAAGITNGELETIAKTIKALKEASAPTGSH